MEYHRFISDGFGYYHYLRTSKGLSSFKKPLLITWTGVLLSFIIAVATVDTTETSNNTASDSNTKISAEKAKAEKETQVAKLAYDPYGPDRDCSDFSTGAAAQEFYLAAGGSSSDPQFRQR